MNFRKVALIPLATILIITLLSFALDLFTIMIYTEDARVQTYIGGFYVASMAADPTALASGSTNPDELYEEDDIMKEFVNYSVAAFSGISTGRHTENKIGDTARTVTFPVEEMFIQHVITKCQIIGNGGQRGVRISIEYRVDPKMNTFLPEGVQIAYYPVEIARNFRIMGQ